MKILLWFSALGLAGISHGADHLKEIGTTISRSTETTWVMGWIGESGYTFFPQVSPAHDLQGWVYLPIADYISGSGSKTFTVEGDPSVEPKNFWRLQYTDLNPENLAGDGVPAIFKINVLGIDPFVKATSDASGNGLPDAWEIFHFGAVNVATPGTLSHPHGLTHKEKADLGLDPDVYYIAAGAESAEYIYDSAGRLTDVVRRIDQVDLTPDAEGNLTNAQ